MNIIEFGLFAIHSEYSCFLNFHKNNEIELIWQGVFSIKICLFKNNNL